MAEKLESKNRGAAERAKETYRSKVREALGMFFDQYPDPEKRERALDAQLDVYRAKDSLKAAVSKAVSVAREEDRETFVDEVLSALEPVVEMKVERPEEYDRLQKSKVVHDRNYEPLTEQLTYEIDSDGWVRLHVPEQTQRDPIALITGFRRGFKKAAAYLETHPEVPGVVGSSPLVAHPSVERVLKQRGFDIEPMDETARRKHFPKETGPVKVMRMERGEFIRRFGSKKRK